MKKKVGEREMEAIGTQIEKTVESCPECGSLSTIRVDETGEEICASCGLVLMEQTLDSSPEWRAFTPEEEEGRSRGGGPTTILSVDKGLSTVIERVGWDAGGREISPLARSKMLRLRRWQRSTQYQSSLHRNLYRALAELDGITDKLHITEDVQEEAASIYRKSLDKGLVRGRSISSIVAASLYAACRRLGRPRSLKEISSMSRMTENDIARDYRLIVSNLGLRMPVPDSKIYVSKIANKVKLSERTQNVAITLLREAESNRAILGKDPNGLAAAALYIASKMNRERKNQSDIARSAEVSIVTLRNRYQGLKNSLHLKF